MTHNDHFGATLALLRAGDESAATLIVRRYVRVLTALASRQFETRLRDRADIEGVVQSALATFLLRVRLGEFRLSCWEDLSGLLAMITLRECARRHRELKAARRDPTRESALREDAVWDLPDRSPTPQDLAMFNEVLGQLVASLEPEDAPVIELILMGFTSRETAQQLERSERTVTRVRHRARFWLGRLLERGSVGG
jgi:RNA polymerase sigma factor (sigma-70 family)